MSKSVTGTPKNIRPSLRRQAGRWVRLSPLGRDLVIILILKLAALALLWWIFFSQPTATHMRVEPSRVEARLLSPASSQEHPSAIR